MACQFGMPDEALIEFAGKTWCPFHLPFDLDGEQSGKREWDMEATAAIGNALLAFINMAITNKKPVDLTGVCFPGETSFEPFADPAMPLPAVLFDDAHFGGGVDFIEVTFAGPASFTDATFDGDADFIVAQFASGADFSDAVFKAGFDVSEARFNGKADFTGAVFEQSAFFREAQFEKTPVFGAATFATAPVFAHVSTPDGPDSLPSSAGMVP